MFREKKLLVSALFLGALVLVGVGGAGKVSAATVIGNNVSVGGSLTVAGSATTTVVTTSNYISVGGTPLSSNASYTNGSVNLTGRLSVDGAAYVSSTLNVTGASRFYSTLTVDGLMTMGVGFISNASSSVAQLNVSGNLNASGTSYFGGNLIPGSNNSYDVGELGNGFRNAYVSSSLTIGGGSGVSSTAITAHLSIISNSIDFHDMSSTTIKCEDTGGLGADITVPGAVVGDTTLVAPLTYDAAFVSGTLHSVVSAANTVRLVYCGATAGAAGDADNDPADMRYRVDVWKH